jgi:hypothetical protein
MRYSAPAYCLPGFLRRHVLHCESAITGEVARFASALKVAEAACGAGSSTMLEAVVRSSMPVSLVPERRNS